MQGANKPDFSDAEILATVSCPDRLSIVMDVSTPESFRYVRLVFPDREVIPNRDDHNKLMAWGNVGELIFYDVSGQPLDGEVIYSSGLDRQNTLRAFDNQPYTSMPPRWMDSIPLGKVVWIGRDLGVSTQISRIEILPKNGNVFLLRGSTYELFYWEKGGWRSLGAQKATKPELVFQGVPRKALLLLRVLDLPLKERIFTYENGRQVWW